MLTMAALTDIESRLLALSDAIGQRYGAQRRPSLVFVRDGRYVTTVSGMHDWPDFLALVRNALASPTTHAPIAIQSAGAAASSCH